ncbi:MAG: MYG1 family protein [Candidatus Paceibacterota bacterium]|jgi:uncharacterized UPF0160 family protein
MEIKIKKLITHNGSFHADDIFACATLSILLEKKREIFEIIRTRDEEIIKNGDYVFDVGGIYDENLNRFDHHQKGGAGKRENGIEYSSFGLVWKKFGEELCGSVNVAKIVEEHIVEPVDAIDNGTSIYTSKISGVFPYDISYVVSIFNLSFNDIESDPYDEFIKFLPFAKNILLNEIKKSKDQEYIEKYISSAVEKKDEDSKILILDKYIPRVEINIQATKYKDILFVVVPADKKFKSWKLLAVSNSINSFENRKNLPSSWSGLKDEEFQKVSGVSDAIFCHRGLFLAVAKSKEGAIKLAELSLSV